MVRDDILLRSSSTPAVAPAWLVMLDRPEMLRIKASMHKLDSYALLSGSGMCKACVAGIFHLALCFSPCRQARR